MKFTPGDDVVTTGARFPGEEGHPGIIDKVAGKDGES